MSAPTHPIALAIARNDIDALRAAIAQMPPGWQEEVVEGYTCWTRVLVDKRRTHLLPVLLQAGVNADKVVRFNGKLRRPFSLCVKHGRHQAALQLLQACASFNVWVHNPKLSALGAVVQQWKQACQDDKTPVVVREPLDALLAHMLTPDTVVLPEVLHGLMQSLIDYPKPEGPRRILLLEAIDTAWKKGVRPDAGPIAREMRHVITPLRLALKDNSPQVHQWLREVLTFCPPTALWAETLLLDVVNVFDAGLEKARQALAIVAEGWRIQDRPWIAHEVNVWSARWEIKSSHASLVAPQVQVRLELLKWGLANGLPVSSLLEGARPLMQVMFSPRALASVGKPDFFMEVFELAFRQGLSLSTLVGRDKNQTWRAALAKDCAKRTNTGNANFALTFWEKHHRQVEQLQARVRAEQLNQSWGHHDDMVARPTPRF